MAKLSIVVRNSTGSGRTSPKGALKLVARGLARYVNEHEVRMIESDPRFTCETEAEPEMATSPTPIQTYEYDGPENLRTFCCYPDSQLSIFGKAA